MVDPGDLLRGRIACRSCVQQNPTDVVAHIIPQTAPEPAVARASRVESNIIVKEALPYALKGAIPGMMAVLPLLDIVADTRKVVPSTWSVMREALKEHAPIIRNVILSTGMAIMVLCALTMSYPRVAIVAGIIAVLASIWNILPENKDENPVIKSFISSIWKTIAGAGKIKSGLLVLAAFLLFSLYDTFTGADMEALVSFGGTGISTLAMFPVIGMTSNSLMKPGGPEKVSALPVVWSRIKKYTGISRLQKFIEKNREFAAKI